MNNKKSALQSILKALTPYRDLAECFLLILHNYNNIDLIDDLYGIIYNEINNIKNTNNMKKIKASLKRLKQKEEEENKENEIYLDNLLNSI